MPPPPRLLSWLGTANREGITMAKPWVTGQSHPGRRGPGLFQVTYLQELCGFLETTVSFYRWRSWSTDKGISLPRVTHLSSWWQSQVISQVLTPHPSSF